jgi:hypothetical protein
LESYVSNLFAFSARFKAKRAPGQFQQSPGAGPSHSSGQARKFRKTGPGHVKAQRHDKPEERKRKFAPGACIGCGKQDHKIGDAKPDGSPMCPNFDKKKHFLKNQGHPKGQPKK